METNCLVQICGPIQTWMQNEVLGAPEVSWTIHHRGNKKIGRGLECQTNC